MNIDKLASDIIAGYNDLTPVQKNNIDFEDIDKNDKRQLSFWTNSMEHIPFLCIDHTTSLSRSVDFYYVQNPKDQKMLSLLYEYPGDGKWFGGEKNMCRGFYKTFKDICTEEYQEQYNSYTLTRDFTNRLYRIQNLEIKAVQATKSYKTFEDFDTFLEYLESISPV